MTRLTAATLRSCLLLGWRLSGRSGRGAGGRRAAQDWTARTRLQRQSGCRATPPGLRSQVGDFGGRCETAHCLCDAGSVRIHGWTVGLSFPAVHRVRLLLFPECWGPLSRRTQVCLACVPGCGSDPGGALSSGTRHAGFLGCRPPPSLLASASLCPASSVKEASRSQLLTLLRCVKSIHRCVMCPTGPTTVKELSVPGSG